MNRTKLSLSTLLIALALACGGRSALAKDSAALDLARQLNDAFIEVADKVSPAVVIIQVTLKPQSDENGDGSLWDWLPPGFRQPNEDQGQDDNGQNRRHHRRHQQSHKDEAEGSGIIISDDGYILTNNHVVDEAEKITVRFKDGREFVAEVKGTDPESDIAVIKIKATGLTPAVLGDSDKTRVGEFVLAIGAPFGYSYSVTVGHVSAKGRSMEGESSLPYADQDFIQTDASINPGNSGGPLVNLYGEVIAINSMIVAPSTGIGFAIPINLAKRVKDHLINEGKFTRSWLGIHIGDLRDYQEFKHLDKSLAPDAEDGVVVGEIEPNGPAAKSDLEPSDVIIAIDGKTVKTSRELKDIISSTKPGHTVDLSVVRGKEHLNIKVRLEALPSEDNLAKATQPPDTQAEKAAYGLTVQALTKDLADQYQVDVTTGVIITAVERNSPAEEQHLKPGDVITEINRKPISTPHQFRDAVKAVAPKSSLMVNLISDGASRFVLLKDTGE